MIQNISYKDFFKRYGIFVVFLAAIFIVLIYSVKISQKSWTKNLRTAVEVVLDEKDPNGWSVEKNVDLKNSFGMNGACYEVRNRKDGDIYLAVIVRIQSLYGPVPAIFTLDKENNVNFMGYSSVHGMISSQLMNNQNNKRLEYWIEKLPIIFEGYFKENDNNKIEVEETNE